MLVELEEKKEFQSTIKLFGKIVITNQYFWKNFFLNLKVGYSPIAVICGRQGSGKSFVALHLALMMIKVTGKSFDIRKNTFYDAEFVIKNLDQFEREPILIDEAGSLLSKREWYDKTHQALDKIVQTQRFRQNFYIFVSPFTSDIDKVFLKHFDYQIRVDDRGKFKVWKIKKKYDSFKDDKAMRRFFYDDVRVNKSWIDPKFWKEYEEYSQQEKEKIRRQQLRKRKVRDDNLNNPLSRVKEKLWI